MNVALGEITCCILPHGLALLKTYMEWHLFFASTLQM
jgi:hypothetical protein